MWLLKFGDDAGVIIEFLDQQRMVLRKQSETYTVILIVNQIVRNLSRWSKKIFGSELGYYRRVAAILDTLLEELPSKKWKMKKTRFGIDTAIQGPTRYYSDYHPFSCLGPSGGHGFRWNY
ncbi:unnamed protein product [Absidia cylindrospora]